MAPNSHCPPPPCLWPAPACSVMGRPNTAMHLCTPMHACRDSWYAAYELTKQPNNNPHLEWCAVRPEWFVEGPAAPERIRLDPKVRCLERGVYC